MKAPARIRKVLLATILALTAAVGPARADEDEGSDHDRALEAVERGKARPLTEVLRLVRARLGGEVIGVELEREHGRYVYEFKVVSTSGRLREVYVDAISAEILQEKHE